jgi:hypothetical protein
VVRDGRSKRIDEEEVVAALREELNYYNQSKLERAGAAAKALAPYLRRFYSAWDEN